MKGTGIRSSATHKITGVSLLHITVLAKGPGDSNAAMLSAVSVCSRTSPPSEDAEET